MISSLFIAALHARAFADKPTCADFKQRMCNVFDEHHGERYIRLADGTRALNSMFEPYSRSPADEPEMTASTNGSRISNEKLMAKTLKMLDVRGLSMDARNAVADHASEIFSTEPGTLHIATPLGAANGKRIRRARGDVAIDLERAMGAAKFAAFKDFVKKNEGQFKEQAEQLRQNTEFMSSMNNEMEDLEIDTKLLAAREAKVTKIFADAKAFEIALVSGGKPRAEWSAEQVNLISRIEPLTLKVMSKQATAAEGFCQFEGVPNAFNNHRTKTVELCRQMLLQTDGALAFELAHEIGHAIDPCAMQNDLATVDRLALEAFKATPGLSKDEASALASIDADAKYLGPEHFEGLVDTGLYPRLIDAGALYPVAKRTDDNPEIYRKTYGCLAKKYGLREPSAAVREARIADKKAALSSFSGQDPKTRDERLKRYRHFLESRKDCAALDAPKPGDVAKPPQMMEAIADVFGELYQEKFLTENPPRTDLERALSLFPAGASCVEGKDHVTTGDHPEHGKRISMQLDLPGIANAVGCTRDEAGCFDELSSQGKAATGGPGVTGATR